MYKIVHVSVAAMLANVCAWGQAKLSIQLNTDNLNGARVVVRNQQGFERSLTASGIITLPQRGEYTITPIATRKINTIVDEIHEAPRQNIRISKDSTYVVQVDYTKRNATGMLLMPDRNQRILGFAQEQLTTKDNAPALVIQTPTNAMLLAADTSGNLWYWDNQFLYRIDVANLQTGIATPSLKVALPSVSNALFNANVMRIDEQNIIWFSLNNERQLVGYDIAKLKNKSLTSPMHILQHETQGFDFVFAPDGKRVAIAGVAGFAVYAMPQTLTAGTQQLAAICRSKDVGSCTSILFDNANNLIIAHENGGIYRYGAALIQQATVQKNDDYQIIETNKYNYWGLLLDNSNNLWALPRWVDGGVGVDYFEFSRKNKLKSPTRSLSFARHLEHGKAMFNVPALRR